MSISAIAYVLRDNDIQVTFLDSFNVKKLVIYPLRSIILSENENFKFLGLNEFDIRRSKYFPNIKYLICKSVDLNYEIAGLNNEISDIDTFQTFFHYLNQQPYKLDTTRLNILYWDIETYAPNSQFPDPDCLDNCISLISAFVYPQNKTYLFILDFGIPVPPSQSTEFKIYKTEVEHTCLSCYNPKKSRVHSPKHTDRYPEAF